MKDSRILIVDDVRFQRQLMEQRLQAEGFEVELCPGGEEALAVVAANPPDLVLMDLNMPGMDGFGVLSQIRANYDSLQLPVIMLTAEENQDTVVKAFAMGANDYVVKAAPFRIITQRVRIQLTLKALASSSARAKEVAAVSAMIVTYNHEINNALAIAVLSLGSDFSAFTESRYEKVRQVMERIRNLMQQIQDIEPENLEYEDYTENTLMVKLTKKSS